MKKLSLRAEHLGDLSTDELRAVAGAAGQAGVIAQAAGTVSDGSCVCYLVPAIHYEFKCDISDGSCVCTQP